MLYTRISLRGVRKEKMEEHNEKRRKKNRQPIIIPLEKQEIMEKRICTQCAAVYEISKEDQVLCPICRSPAETKHYEELINYVQGAIEYGYLYRLEYEEQYEKNAKLSRRYSIVVSDVLTFCALAALSGIIGGIAYDTVKGVIKKYWINIKKEEK